MGRFDHRYWNGTAWTDAVSRQGIEATDALDTPDSAPKTDHVQRIPPPPPMKVNPRPSFLLTKKGLWVLVLIAVAVLVVVLVAKQRAKDPEQQRKRDEYEQCLRENTGAIARAAQCSMLKP